MLNSLLLITLSAAIARADAAALNSRQYSRYTVASGYLSATVSGSLHSFTRTSGGLLGYTGDGVSPLYVDFQACSDSQDNDWGEYTGRLYIPSTNQCVTVTNQSSSNAPYYPAVAACQSTPAAAYYAQHWDYREEENGALRWLGKTDWEGSTPQGDCGQFGYEADASGVPTLTSSGQVTLGCYEATVAFKLSSATD